MSVYFCGGTCIEDMTFYIRTNCCGSLYNDIFALRGWKKEELGGIEFELNSILAREMEREGIPSCNPKAEAQLR